MPNLNFNVKNRILSLLSAALVLGLTSCQTSYIDTLHDARVRIYRAVHGDGTLKQSNLNAGSSIAMHLTADEVTYWEGELMMLDVDVPDWRTRFKEIADEPTGYEGGSIEPLVRHTKLYDYLDSVAAELKKLYFEKKKETAKKNRQQKTP